MRQRIHIGIIVFFIFLGVLLRFSYLNWGQPFFFHPDENNIVYAIKNIRLSQWNPHFFAYGGLPIYISFIFSYFVSFGYQHFATIAYVLRFISATLSFLLLFLLFYVGKKFYGKSTGVIAMILASVSIGFIQFAHFGTFEMWLSFFSLLFAYICYVIYTSCSYKSLLSTGIIGGILLSIKISSFIFMPVPILLLSGLFLQKKMSFIKLTLLSTMYSIIILSIYFATNPFVFFDISHALRSIVYESSVAVGTIHVFYTQSFLQTTPLIYQFMYVFPFLLNPFVLVSFSIGFIYFCFLILKQQKIQDKIIFIFFILILFSQATVFVKWTRYMIPTLPFIYLILARTLNCLKRKYRIIATTILVFISTIYALAFFFTVYPTDSRIAAEHFAKKYLQNKPAIIEPYDLGTISFNSIFPHAVVINLYQLDNNPQLRQALEQSLATRAIFLSPSQRLWSIRLRDSKDFPKGNIFYKRLFSGTLGYRMIYQTPCNLWCKLVYMGNPAFNVESTANVFDHPIVTIFQHE